MVLTPETGPLRWGRSGGLEYILTRTAETFPKVEAFAAATTETIQSPNASLSPRGRLHLAKNLGDRKNAVGRSPPPNPET
jgi:hypothetical protein